MVSYAIKILMARRLLASCFNADNIGRRSGKDAVQLAFPCFKCLLFLLVIIVVVVGTDDALLDVAQNCVDDLIHESHASHKGRSSAPQVVRGEMVNP